MPTPKRVRQVGQVVLFLIIPVLGGLSPFIVIPVITSKFGVGGWTSVAIAMSIGTAGGVISELGWGVVGPQAVARRRGTASDLYVEALASKLFASVLVAPVAAGTAAALSREHQVASGVIAASLVMASVSPSWFFIGQGRPVAILVSDSLPRILGGVCASGALLIGAPLWTYGAFLWITTFSGLLLAARLTGNPVLPSSTAMRLAPKTIKRQGVISLGRCISTLHTALPASLLGLVNHNSVASFAAVDRPMRMGLIVLAGIPSRMQSWIASPHPETLRARSKVAIVANALLGLCAGVAFFLVGPTVINLLFSGVIAVSRDSLAVASVLVSLICFSRGLGLSIVAFDRANQLTKAVSAAAAVGLIGTLWLGSVFGAVGVFGALCAAEAVGVFMQARSLRLETLSKRRGEVAFAHDEDVSA